MKKILFFLPFIASISKGFGQHNSDMAQLKKLNAQFIENFVNNDADAQATIIHAGFVHISSEGKSINRKDYLDAWGHGSDGYLYWDYRDEQIKLFGNTALVHAKNKFTFVKDGKEITGMSMYTDIYIKEKNEWKCIQAQISMVSAANAASDATIVKKYDLRNKYQGN
jgi:ketosteroid isomerase-like protein